MKPGQILIIVMAVLLLSMLLTRAVEQADIEKIRHWIKQRGVEVKDIEQRFLRLGPFFARTPASRVYRVTTNKGAYWFRFGFGHRIYQQKSAGDYQRIS
jgi:hypothetical protein